MGGLAYPNTGAKGFVQLPRVWSGSAIFKLPNLGILKDKVTLTQRALPDEKICQRSKNDAYRELQSFSSNRHSRRLLKFYCSSQPYCGNVAGLWHRQMTEHTAKYVTTDMRGDALCRAILNCSIDITPYSVPLTKTLPVLGSKKAFTRTV